MRARTKSPQRLLGKKRKRHFIFSNFSIVVLVILTFVFGHHLFGSISKYRLSEEKLSETLLRLEQKEEEKEVLRAKIDTLDTPEGRERAIRERFNVVKENEGVIYVIEDETSFDVELLREEDDSERGFFRNLMEVFGF